MFRRLDPMAPAEPGPPGDLAWWAIFQDEAFQELIRTALAEDYDLRVAAARILAARAQLGSTRSHPFPALDGSADATYPTSTRVVRSWTSVLSSLMPEGVRAHGAVQLTVWPEWRRPQERTQHMAACGWR